MNDNPDTESVFLLELRFYESFCLVAFLEKLTDSYGDHINDVIKKRMVEMNIDSG